MELSAWIVVLMQPLPVFFATDSASMKNKADNRMEAARQWEVPPSITSWPMPRDPFKKPWGLQVDGDLCRLAWEAVLSRGPDSQKLKKVKGHATSEDAENGTVEQRDRAGNNNADAVVGYGVLECGGKRLVKITGWLERRHEK